MKINIELEMYKFGRSNYSWEWFDYSDKIELSIQKIVAKYVNRRFCKLIKFEVERDRKNSINDLEVIKSKLKG